LILKKSKFSNEYRITLNFNISKWFREVYSSKDNDILIFDSEFLNKNEAYDVKSIIEDWSIGHLEYNWFLNDHK
jgi:hypothetical protein